MPDAPPAVPTSAIYFTAGESITLTFSRSVGPFSAGEGGFTGGLPGFAFDFAGGWTAPGGGDSSFVDGVLLSPNGEPSPRLSYDGSDPLAVDDLGRPIPPFTDFPVIII